MNKFIVGICVATIATSGVFAHWNRSEVTSEPTVYKANKNNIVRLAYQSKTMEPVKIPSYDIKLKEKHQKLVWELCQNNDFSYELALAVIYMESYGRENNTNVNKDGTIDKGLFQINSRYADTYHQYAIEHCGLPEGTMFNVSNTDHNIRAGIGGLVHIRNQHREQGVNEDNLVYYVLGIYNQGAGAYSKYVKKNGYLETKYSKKVLRMKYMLESEGKLS